MLNLYRPKTGKFESKLSYDKTFTNHKTKTAKDVYEESFAEISKTSL